MPDGYRRAAWFPALFVSVGWAALEFSSEGVLSVVADRDPLPTGLSPFLGFGLVVLRLFVVFIGVALAGTSPGPWWIAAATGALVWLGTVLAGLVFGGLDLAIAEAAGPFMIVAAVTAVLVTGIAGTAIARRRTPPSAPTEANPRNGV